MAGVNKAIVVGRLGQDPEVRDIGSAGNKVASFSVATSEEWKDKNSGEKREKTEWHKMVAFGRLAEICGQYLRKGKQAYFEGRIQTREYEDRDGNRRWTTEIVVQQMQMLGGKGDGGGGYTGGHGQPPAQDRSRGGERPAPAQRSFPDAPPPPAANDDDIPF